MTASKTSLQHAAKSSMARGTFLLMGGQLIFMISGYFINILLARKLGPQELGLYGIVMAVLVWVEIFIMNGVPTAMQKLLGSGEADPAALTTAGFRLQVVYCLIVWLAFCAATPLMAWFFQDGRLYNLLWIASLDILLYGMYWLYAGILSGKRRFAAQAGTTVSYSLGKLTAVVALVVFGWGVAGAVIGNWLGSGVGLLAGARLAKREKNAATVSAAAREIVRFARPIVFYSIMMNLLLYIDIFCIKRFLTDAEVGYYHVAGTLARVPYFIFIGLSFTLLPVLSRAIADNAQAEAQRRIEQVIRFMAILLVPATLFIWQNSTAVIRWLYTATFDPAAPVMRVLTVSLVLYTFFYIGTTILNADHRPGLSFAFAGIAAAVDLVANILLVPRFGGAGAAAATGIAAFAGLLCTAIYIYMRFRAALRWKSLIRIAVAGTVATFLTVPWPAVSFMLLAKALFFGLIFFGLLALLREIEAGEWQAIARLGTQRNMQPQPDN